MRRLLPVSATGCGQRPASRQASMGPRINLIRQNSANTEHSDGTALQWPFFPLPFYHAASSAVKNRFRWPERISIGKIACQMDRIHPHLESFVSIVCSDIRIRTETSRLCGRVIQVSFYTDPAQEVGYCHDCVWAVFASIPVRSTCLRLHSRAVTYTS